MDDTNNAIFITHRPNKELNNEERELKRKLKQELKRQHRIQKLQRQIYHYQQAHHHANDEAATTRQKQKQELLERQLQQLLLETTTTITTCDKNRDDERWRMMGEKSPLPVESAAVEATITNTTTITSNHEDNASKRRAEESNRRRICKAKSFVENIYFQVQQTWQKETTNGDEPQQKLQESTAAAPTVRSSGGSSSSRSGSKDSPPPPRRRRRKQQQAEIMTRNKEERNQKARILLQNMAKGTLKLEMFNNNLQALRGYTRHKFIERAMLIVNSINKLVRRRQENIAASAAGHDIGDHSYSSNGGISMDAFTTGTIESGDTMQRMYRQFRNVRSIVSIGCGPGCDAVGVVAALSFLFDNDDKEQQQRSFNKDAVVTRPQCIYLLDWAMKQWYPITSVVRNVLLLSSSSSSSSSSDQICSIDSIDMATCDIRASYSNQPTTSHSNNDGADTTTVTTGDDDFSSFSFVDDENLMVVVSYLLSETRDQWQNFMDDVVQQCPAGTLFLLTDPAAWQLHVFRQRYGWDCTNNDQQKKMEFLWLDSSMSHPELQVLEGRLGPAVLLARKL